MGTHVRQAQLIEVPERVAAVAVGVLWGRRHEPRPELLPVTEVGVAIVDCSGGEPLVESRYLLTGGDLPIAAEHLFDLGLPLVGFNPLGFDWIALEGLHNGATGDVSPLIERTIDLRSTLHDLVPDMVAAEGVDAFPRQGEYGVLNPHSLAEANLGVLPGGNEDARGEAEMTAALWHQIARSGRAMIAARTHALDDDALELVRGGRARFAGAAEWRETLVQRPAPRAYRRRKPHPITFPRVDQRYV